LTVIKRTEAGISISGHAGYAEHGKDIVCAAVSVMAQNLIRSIEELTEDKIEYYIGPGSINIEFGELSEEARLLMDSFYIGAAMISEEYPENVTIE
jgi:uncharacterized protein YsxB (DUF464 family)